MDPHSNVVIKYHGNYIQNQPYSLTPVAKKPYTPTRNDDQLNTHNHTILSLWCENVDCQPVVYIHAVQKYITKYASKAEKNLKASTTCYVELSWLHPLLTQQNLHFETFLKKPLLIMTLEHKKPAICCKNYH